ncbi:hypothetical protein OSB04_032034 [Centaurea solstitialis]|uniref:Uncharacterized protein n=1 Tax=Centaurea solstitialis TaxID=347529 RepID=A0AA38W8P3_9ASTR|nr:hypothetical protein OSB04_032034 [Centaurea solstitialis]
MVLNVDLKSSGCYKKVISKIPHKSNPNDTEAPTVGVDDITKLAYLYEPRVLYNLATQFASTKYMTPFGELSLHLFAIDDDCYYVAVHYISICMTTKF